MLGAAVLVLSDDLLRSRQRPFLPGGKPGCGDSHHRLPAVLQRESAPGHRRLLRAAAASIPPLRPAKLSRAPSGAPSARERRQLGGVASQ